MQWEVDWHWSLCCTVTQTSCHLAVQAVLRSVSLSLLCTALGTVCDIRLLSMGLATTQCCYCESPLSLWSWVCCG